MRQTGWDKDVSPYHDGERELHERLGRKDEQDQMGRAIHRSFMPRQHRDFFERLPFFIAGSLDSEGWPWASILFGPPGFLRTPSDRRLTIDAGWIDHDPFLANATPGAPVGFLGIELPTRRRNRMNGNVGSNDGLVSVDVVQSYGNCPQYIYSRDFEEIRNPRTRFTPEIERFETLPEHIVTLIERSDVFYVASVNLEADLNTNGGADVNHRGGKPGFVRVQDNTLTIPDFIGNFAFSTLGNFLVYPKAGLLFIDPDKGDLIQLTGRTEVLWDKDREVEAFRGAERAWRFHLDHGHMLKAAAPYRWSGGELSPHSALTGDWAEATAILNAQDSAETWRDFRIANVVDESSVIKSFHLIPEDEGPLIPFKPGQFLTLQVHHDGAGATLTRTYTVSSAPSDPFYRISVKREGMVSSYLHDRIGEGSTLKIRPPKGDFWLDTAEKRPAVLLAGGVGITPMVSMARQALTDLFARRHMRSITLIHAARTVKQRAFAAELKTLQTASQNRLRYFSVIDEPAPDDQEGHDFHEAGFVSADLLQSLLALDDYDFYLCGPPPFMQIMYDTLLDLGVRDSRIQAEGFGPASITRRRLDPDPRRRDTPAAASQASVTFVASKKVAQWTEDQGSLLEFAESQGLNPAFGCRGGACGSCATRLVSGQVTYLKEPTFDVANDRILICCSVPAAEGGPLALEL